MGSTLDPIPYPAKASVPNVPTKPVKTNIVPTVKRGEAEAGIATSKIFEKSFLFKTNWPFLSLAGTVLLESLIVIIVTIKVLLKRAATAAPETPSWGNPNHPKIKPPDNNTCIKEAITIRVAGKRMFPIPLSAALRLPDNQISNPPKKSTEQYS